MSRGRENRTERRIRASSPIRVRREDGSSLSGRFELLNLSGQGIAFKSPCSFKPGTFLICEVNEYNLSVRAEVRHSSRSLFSAKTGVQFAGPPGCID